jgi:glycosyltransferase involved in cell wall biosynthesis
MKNEPIRILQCMPTNMVCGGIENFIMNIYKNIDRDKVQFDFLTHGVGKNYFEEEIRQLGGEIYRVPFIKEYKKYQRQMTKLLREKQQIYHTIHIHATYAMSYYDAKLAKECKIQNIIMHSHSANTNVKKRKIVQKLLKNQMTKVTNFQLACSKEAAQWMFPKKVVTNHQYNIVKNGIYVENYSFDPKLREKVRKDLQIQENFVVGHVGRLSAAKNHAFLLEVFKEILKEESTAKLLLVGEGELKEKIKQRALELGILEQVIFAGNSEKVQELLQAMDTFVFPSLFEGFGLAVLEAQTTGLPCFLADHITKEVNVTDLVTYISLKESPQYWAKRILDKKENKRENKVEIVTDKKYDIRDIAKELESFYLKID